MYTAKEFLELEGVRGSQFALMGGKKTLTEWRAEYKAWLTANSIARAYTNGLAA